MGCLLSIHADVQPAAVLGEIDLGVPWLRGHVDDHACAVLKTPETDVCHERVAGDGVRTDIPAAGEIDDETVGLGENHVFVGDFVRSAETHSSTPVPCQHGYPACPARVLRGLISPCCRLFCRLFGLCGLGALPGRLFPGLLLGLLRRLFVLRRSILLLTLGRSLRGCGAGLLLNGRGSLSGFTRFCGDIRLLSFFLRGCLCGCWLRFSGCLRGCGFRTSGRLLRFGRAVRLRAGRRQRTGRSRFGGLICGGRGHSSSLPVCHRRIADGGPVYARVTDFQGIGQGRKCFACAGYFRCCGSRFPASADIGQIGKFGRRRL